MAKFNVEFTKTGSDSVRQLVELLCPGSNPRRFQVLDFWVANVAATPLDAPLRYVIRRVTASATGTGVTPNPLNPADPIAAIETAEHLITADHASFASSPVTLGRKSANGRASVRFSVAPGCEYIAAATANNGLSIGTSDVSTSQFDGDVTFEEI